MTDEQDKQQRATKLIPELLIIIESDILKSVDLLEKSIKVAIVAKDEVMKLRLALMYTELEDFSKRLGEL